MNLAIRLAAAALTALLVPAPVDAQARPDMSLEEVVEQARSRRFAPGAVVAVVLRDSVVLMQAFGRTGIDPAAPPLTTDAIVHAAPVAEIVNALAAAHLAHRGRLAMDAEVARLLPELTAELRALTPRQLLSHTAGLAVTPAVPGRGGADDLGAAARGLTALDRIAPPGALYSHSTSGLGLAALVVERSGGRRHADVVQEQVLGPLGMASSGFIAPGSPALAPGWEQSSSIEGPVAPAPQAQRLPATSRATQGFVSNASDLARLAMALLNDGRVNGEQLLPPGVVASLLRAQAAIPGGSSTAATGLRIGRWNGHHTVTIAGGGSGHGVLVHLLPAARLGVIVLTNMSGAALTEVSSFILGRAVPAAAAAVEPPAPADPEVLDRMAAAAGRYLNGSELLEIVVRDGRPMLRSDQLELELRALEGGMVAALLQGREAMRFRFLTTDDGMPYLWLGQRALVRETPRRR